MASQLLGKCRMPYTMISIFENELNVPAAFLHDIADTDERPRIDSEGNWLLTILRIPIFVKRQQHYLYNRTYRDYYQ